MTSEIRTTVMGQPATVRRHGTPGAVPLVLLHGVGGSHKAFDALLPWLTALDVFVPSLPGHPGTPGPVLENAECAAQWVEALLTTQRIARPVVGGHSYGGGMALELAIRGKVTLGGLVLMATGARLRVRADIVEACRVASEEAREQPDDIAHAIHADWIACNRFDRLNAVHTVTVKTLVLSGDQDVFIPRKFAQYLAEHIPGAQWQAFDDGGHDLPSEHPQRVAQAIARFCG